MAVLSSIKIRYENLRTIDFGDILTTYVLVGAPFQNPVRMMKIVNETDQGIFISFDGIDDKDYVPATSGQIYDYCSNKADSAGSLEQSAYTRIYVRSAATPTSGSVYVTIIYASDW